MNATHSACNVLVIDPCPESQACILTHVQGRGYSIIAASDPATALATIELAAPDIVITDLFLPEGAGLRLANELRSRHESCPVIVMAQDAPETVVVQALRAGAADYLHKPIAEEELAHALQRARHLLSENFGDLPGVRRSEYRLTMDSDPAHIPGVIAWVVKTTASTFPETQRLHVRGALLELLLNAVEHGNLEICYREKQKALAEGGYEQLLTQRLAQSRLRDRQVTIDVIHDKCEKSLTYRIADEGKGFKWHNFLHQPPDPCSSADANGRGIFLARSFFPSLTYNDQGNAATITALLGEDGYG